MKRRYIMDDYSGNRYNYAEELRNVRNYLLQLDHDVAVLRLHKDVSFGGIGGKDYFTMSAYDYVEQDENTTARRGRRRNQRREESVSEICHLEFDSEDERNEARAWSRIFNDFKSLAREAGLSIAKDFYGYVAKAE